MRRQLLYTHWKPRYFVFQSSIASFCKSVYNVFNVLHLKGLRGNSIIVEGINTGTAIVKAKLSHPTFKVSYSTITEVVFTIT